ncbi:MAG: hypothetical protein OHK0052_06820 [Anaerolineales bacterium]
MNEVTVGIRDLKTRLSEYLNLVRSGQTIVITSRGRAVGRILPVEQPLEQRLQSLQAAGLMAWNGKSLTPLDPPAKNLSENSLADLVILE